MRLFKTVVDMREYIIIERGNTVMAVPMPIYNCAVNETMLFHVHESRCALAWTSCDNERHVLAVMRVAQSFLFG